MKKILLSGIALVLTILSFSQVKVQNLLTEHLTDPVSLDVITPRFYWQLVSDKRNVMQTAY
jgi:alpha-L-rhamnosidase